MIRKQPIVRLRQVCKGHETSMFLEALNLDFVKGSFAGVVASE